jgi:hypothetical protein
MSTVIQPRLPTTFTSLYRLFLRICSASVLHHRPATRNLRQLWRPTFDAAAKVTRELHSQDVNTRNHGEGWLRLWEQRSEQELLSGDGHADRIWLVDNTLAFLYNSCQSRGVPHQVTRNLGFLVLSEHQRLRSHQFQSWSPQLPLTSPRYKPSRPLDSQQKLKEERLKRWADFDVNALAALSEVVRMAEGRQNMSLGQIAIKRKVWRTKRGN